ncbi:DUF465 domain-containing protein [Novosphingobium sp. 1949]|uniref:DUF465 domain-containing protein n=1 Tax=Novosphingobium organovorum TaxID=2930092 RepID=A0ABT0BG91_9SPHN|nr:DUF465 domain-containing protein [Novosphingobium organovorum]MCJ2184077.1 DUF465 domain-containing protein [Novosphingobium organovorum]
MTDTMYRTLEKLQRLDSRLRLAQQGRNRDPLEIALLKAMKKALRGRLSRPVPAMAPA